jgi:non-homologous end joining protein Ku
LSPLASGLLGTTLRYLYEVRDAKDYFGHLPELALAPDMLALAAQILESKVADFDPRAFRDRYEEALLAYLKAKQVGTVQERNPTSATPRGVINLMEALRRSVSKDKKQPRRAGEPRSLQRARRDAVPRADRWTAAVGGRVQLGGPAGQMIDRGCGRSRIASACPRAKCGS